MARRRKGQPGGWFSYAPNPAVSRPWKHWAPQPADQPAVPPDSVKLMPEYSVELPLWHSDWRQLGLSSQLLDDLADWQAEFDANFHPSKGWTDPAVRQRWEEQAVRLIGRLREALPKGTRLEIDLWPLSR